MTSNGHLAYAPATRLPSRREDTEWQWRSGDAQVIPLRCVVLECPARSGRPKTLSASAP
jgi:hypothetical protein